MTTLRRLLNNHRCLLKLNGIPVTTNLSIDNNYYIRIQRLASKPLYDYSLLRDQDDVKICLAREKLGFKTPPLFVLRKSTIYMYESCTDHLDIARFFQQFNLDDTFSSWFAVTRWHVWMVACRLMSMENKTNAKTLRNELLKRMWEDVNNRMDKLSYMKRRVKFRLIQHYYAEFNATLFGMDEGVISDDIVLAGAIWRTILGMQTNLQTNNNADPESSQEARPEPPPEATPKTFDPIILDQMVRYTRVQLKHLKTIPDNYLMFDGLIQWNTFPMLITNKTAAPTKKTFE